MADKPWAQVLDEIYRLGGNAEYPSNETEGELDSDVDLSQRLDLDVDTVQNAVETLLDRHLATDTTVGIDDDEIQRNSVTLQSDGFQLAHDRDQAQRDQANNQAVTLLTLVLAFVGMAQATALTAQSSDIVNGAWALAIWAGAFWILIITYFGLIRAGALNFKNMTR